MFRTIHRYEEDGLGLPYPVVLIDAAEEEIDDVTRDRIGISVPDLEGLAVAVAVARVLLPVHLTGKEVRFLRNVLDMTGRQMAEAIDIDPCNLSKWENDKAPLGGWADKQVRLITIVALSDRVPHLSLDKKSVISMNIVNREPGTWPEITMHRLHHVCAKEDTWDMQMAA